MSLFRRLKRLFTGEKRGSRRSLLGRLTVESVDPGGWGVPHNTERNRQLNRMKTTDQIIAEIEERNQAGKPTWRSGKSLHGGCSKARWTSREGSCRHAA
jgi:hypothetical protein